MIKFNELATIITLININIFQGNFINFFVKLKYNWGDWLVSYVYILCKNLTIYICELENISLLINLGVLDVNIINSDLSTTINLT